MSAAQPTPELSQAKRGTHCVKRLVRHPMTKPEYEELSFNDVIARLGMTKAHRGPMPYGIALLKDGVEVAYDDCGGLWKWLRYEGYIE
jgi:hypothetical protein